MACFYYRLWTRVRPYRFFLAVFMGLITSLTLQAQNQPCTTSLSISVGSCSTLTNNYSLTGIFTANDVDTPPLTVTVTSGTSTVIQSLTANNNTFAFTFNGLPSDGQQKTITVATSSTACSTIIQSYTAPASCTTALPCSLSLALNPGICNSATNAYSLTGVLTGTNLTTPLTVTVIGAGFNPIVQSLTAVNTTFSFLVNGLTADGIQHSITINTSETACGSISQTYTAPIACSAALPCITSLTITPTACNSTNNSYNLGGVFSVTNGPSSGLLTIATGGGSLTYAVTSSAGNYSFSFGNLPSDGSIGTVTASFSGTSCGPVSGTYDAPASCSVAIPCSVSLVLTPGVCNTLTNTFSLTGTLANANSSQPTTVTVTGAGISPIIQSLTAVNNVFTFTINGLLSDGLTKTLTATFSGTSCGSVSQTFTTPVSCSQSQQQLCSVSLAIAPTDCNSATNSFTINGAVTIANGPSSGSLTVTNGSLSLTFPVSPTVSTYNFAFNNLPSTGAIGTITATFSGTSCGPVSQTFTAPASCSQSQQQPCSLTLALSPGICSSATNTYSLSGTLSANNLTPPINVTISGSGFTPLVQSLTAVNNTVNFTVNGLSSDGILKTITVNTSASACSVLSNTYTAPISCTQNTSPGPCPQIDLTTINNSQICNGQCASFSVITSTTAVIQLVRFTSPQTGTAVYSGGIVMDEGTPTNGVLVLPQGIPGLSFPQNTGTSPVTYYVYAILKNQPTDPNCRPFAVTQVTILPSPQFSLTSIPVCSSSQTRPILVSIPATGTYTVTFAENVGAVSCGLATPSGIVTTLTVTGGTTATALVPTSFIALYLVANQTTNCQSFSSVGQATFLPSPTFSVAATPVSCSGVSPNSNGSLAINNVVNGITYQYSTGSSFNSGNAVPNGPQAIPGGGVVVANLANPATSAGQTYTIRVYGSGGCATDQVVTLPFRDCGCAPAKCLPLVAEKIR